MNTTVISVKIDKKTKIQAQKIAEELGFSLSAVIKAQLKHFIRSKRVDVSYDDEEPSDYFIQSLKEADEDIKAGRVISFKNSDEMLKYLDKHIEDAKKKQTRSTV